MGSVCLVIHLIVELNLLILLMFPEGRWKKLWTRATAPYENRRWSRTTRMIQRIVIGENDWSFDKNWRTSRLEHPTAHHPVLPMFVTMLSLRELYISLPSPKAMSCSTWGAQRLFNESNITEAIVIWPLGVSIPKDIGFALNRTISRAEVNTPNMRSR
jgi:hypothetical protein